jgi:hypothetical protein
LQNGRGLKGFCLHFHLVAVSFEDLVNLLAHFERVVLVGVLLPQMMVVLAVKYNPLEFAVVDKQVLRSVLKPEE